MKALPWLLVIAGAVLAAHHFCPKTGSLCERVFEMVPDDFPPKRMFLNVVAIREQNERIIELLEAQAESGG